MNEPSGIVNGFRFGEFSFNQDTAELYKNAALVIQFAQYSHIVFLMLLEHAQETVSREQLVRAVWKDSEEPEGGLRGLITKLRDALADDPDHPEYIQTIRGRGYRFMKPVERLMPGAHPPNRVPPAPEATAPDGPAISPNTERVKEDPPSTRPQDEVPTPGRGEKSSRPKWLIWAAVAGIILTALAAVFMLRPKPLRTVREETPPVSAVPEITITSPGKGEKVNHRHRVKGQVRAPGAGVCIVVHPDGEEGYHTQPSVEVEPDGTWRVEGYFGVRGSKDVGRSFDVRAIAGCNALGTSELTGWPEGSAHSEIVTVTRQ